MSPRTPPVRESGRTLVAVIQKAYFHGVSTRSVDDLVKAMGAVHSDLDAVVAERCVALANDRDLTRGQAGFHWWPSNVAAN